MIKKNNANKEFAILLSLNNSNIVKFIEAFKDNDTEHFYFISNFYTVIILKFKLYIN